MGPKKKAGGKKKGEEGELDHGEIGDILEAEVDGLRQMLVMQQ